MTASLLSDVERSRLRITARARVLFADTDKLGVVYHASYLRYLEHARVEMMREMGLAIPTFEPRGLGLPLTELAVRYRAPAKYDDLMSFHTGVSLLTPARLHFQYLVTIEPGGRDGLGETIEVLWAETRHACIRLSDGRPERLPADVVALLESCYTRG
ncbi:MAG TPA: thioesterase family protein [Nannocystaceae bacterium]|nr:thioesterase family protein [Nannocystaceae bacterium]